MATCAESVDRTELESRDDFAAAAVATGEAPAS